MMTYYNISVPELPPEFIQYCDSSNYNLSGKKKQIVAYIMQSTQETDIDTLQRNIRMDGVKVSLSSSYLVLQWLTNHGFVTKTINNYNKVVYKPGKPVVNFE